MVDAAAYGEVQDPATAPARLAELAAAHPELQSLIAVHPRIYPALQEWIARYGRPEARADAARALAEGAPEPAAAPAAQPAASAGPLVAHSGPASASPASPAVTVPVADSVTAVPPAGDVPPRAAVTPRARTVAWAVAGGVAVLAAAVAIPLTLGAMAADAPAGVLADGTAWGPSLGAEVQRATDVSAGGTGLGRLLGLSPATGAAYVGGWEGLHIVDASDLSRSALAPILLESGSAAIAISPDGTRAYLTAGSGGDTDGELVALSLSEEGVTEEYRTTLPGTGNMGENTAVSPDGATLYLADGNTGFWAVSTTDGSVRAHPFGGMATTVAVNPVDGTVVVDAPLEDAILLLDATGTRELRRLYTESGLPDAIAISPDGRTIAVGENGTVRLYGADGASGSSIELSASIADLAFSPDSAEIAVLTSWDEGNWGAEEREGVRLIDVASARELTRIPLRDTYILGNLAFSGNPGEMLALSGDGLVRIDIAASRTNGGGYIAVLAVLALAVLAAVLAAATISRWKPALAASRQRSRQAQAQRREEAQAQAAQAQAQRTADAVAAEQARTAAEHAERVRQVQQWRDAYREANGGQEPPAGFVPMAVPASPAPPARTGTNVMAILALIFGFGGGLLGIVFGHIALGQIRRTGEAGRGLAITGLVFGYIGLAVIIAWIVVAVVFLGAFSRY